MRLHKRGGKEPDDVERILGEIRRGENVERNWTKLYSKFFRMIFSFFVKKGFPRNESEELAQDVFMKAFASFEDFEGKASFKTWIFLIAVNHMRDLLRKKRVKADSLDWDFGKSETVPLAERIADMRGDPEGEIIAGDTLREIEESLRALSPTQRTVFILKEIQDVPVKEISKNLGITERTAYNSVSEAKSIIRKRLDTGIKIKGGRASHYE